MKFAFEPSVDSSDWNGLLESDPASTFFHRLQWLESLEAAYPYYRKHILVARDPAGRVIGGVPGILSVRSGLKQLLSLPYGTYATPLANGASTEERRAVRLGLVDAWRNEARDPGVVRAQLVFFDAEEDISPRLPRRGLVSETTHVLDLAGGFEAVWTERFRGDRRTETRKAEKAGVESSIETNAAGAKVLAEIYRAQSASWTNHTPVPSRLYHELVDRSHDCVRILVARRDGTPLSAKLVFLHNGTTTTWMQCSTPEARRLAAGVLLYTRAIEDACSRGDREFNFGATQGNPDIERFKEGFGTRAVGYGSYLHEAGWFRPLHRAYYRLKGIRET